ncbi:MAG: methyltransferase domain-containing protein [Candidatus Zixiibacteriota bacterium]
MLSNVSHKRAYFNNYWHTRDISSADARSIQRAKFVESLLRKDKGQKIIDVGCGRGTVLIYLRQHGYVIGGCDIATDTVNDLIRQGYDAFICDLETEPLPEKYDVIMCLEVLQQVFDPIKIIQKFRQALYANGCLIISVPNEFHLLSRIKLVLGKSHLGHFEESHIRLFSPKRVRELFIKTELTVLKTIPVSIFPPHWKILQPLGKMLARIIPGLFSLSQIYMLEPNEYNADKIRL